MDWPVNGLSRNAMMSGALATWESEGGALSPVNTEPRNPERDELSVVPRIEKRRPTLSASYRLNPI
jgi:hypothetical protein